MKTLIEQFNSLSLQEKEYAILPLGQHSFVVKTKNKTIWLDPFLTDLEGRNVPVLCRADEVCVADIITGSHDHADHRGPQLTARQLLLPVHLIHVHAPPPSFSSVPLSLPRP